MPDELLIMSVQTNPQVAGVSNVSYNPVTGNLESPPGTPISVGGATWLKKNVRLNPQAMSVMASAPTVTASQTNTLSAGQFFAAANGDASAAVGDGAFNLFRSAYYQALGSSYPAYFYITSLTFTQGSPSAYANLTTQLSFRHTGSRFAIFLSGNGASMLVKVDGQFVSLTPTALANDGNLYYVLVDFSSAVADRRIDILMFGAALGGVYTDQTDSMRPASQRGPKVVVLNDSFGEGTGNEVSQLYSWITYFAEYLGWDNVVSSAVGATGLLAGALPKVPYGARAARDVAALFPDAVYVKPSINDNGYTPAQMVAAAQALIATVNAAGCYPTWIFGSPTINGGAGVITGNSRAQNVALRNWAKGAGYLYLDSIEMPYETMLTPQATTCPGITALNATSVVTAVPLVPGGTYKFNDGTAFFVHSVSGTTSTVDKINAAQAAGATVTQCGPTYLTGTGHATATTGWGSCDLEVAADGTHPLNRGHRDLGYTDANLLLRAIAV